MIAFKKWTGMFGGKTSDTDSRKVQVRVPRDYFKRADAFLEDVKVMTKEQLPGLNKAFLVKLLFDNFLEKIRHDIDLYDYLVFLNETYGSIVTEAAGHDTGSKTGLPRKPAASSGASKFRWSLPASPGGKTEEDDCPTLSITLHPREVSRVEVFFDDLRWKRMPIDLELDELVALLFIEFIVALRNGLTEETKQEIIDFIVSRWEEA
ncbi:hypothetical protein PAESOLCIP111_05030 [Paenibacillus solanacearum]|uniref:Uncharacterized protein n=2 Tax=Paenibacillus solanacearum TaxID=2048548 RepID=A0A916K6R3_9BACL|nr:hypothetical protein PAESOLCIP111_05030 [Paenibacillus solanacearum]